MSSLYAKSEWRPKVGQLVSGKQGKRYIIGTVVADPAHPKQPKVRSVGYGCVLLFVACTDADGNVRERGINQVAPAGNPQGQLFESGNAQGAISPGESSGQAQQEPEGMGREAATEENRSNRLETPNPAIPLVEPLPGYRINRWGEIVPIHDLEEGDSKVASLREELGLLDGSDPLPREPRDEEDLNDEVDPDEELPSYRAERTGELDRLIAKYTKREEEKRA